ncbi:MAG TPA: hypothetical protein VJ924_09700 [Alphaproteobacteria bacterium]|nr:hypothetical protein [Alphaproteobacteria bacterium]
MSTSTFRGMLRGLGVFAVAAALGACDGGPNNQARLDCEQASYIVLEGARCMMKGGDLRGDAKLASAPIGQSASDPTYCNRRIDDFRDWGLGRYDAEEILRTSLDTYFRKYKDRGFCEELKVKQAFGFSIR